MAQYKVLVLSDCQQGHEGEYSHYYDTKHIPDILREMREVQSAQRFQVEPIFGKEGMPAWRFSCLYSIETDDFQQYLDRMGKAYSSGRIPPADCAIPDTAVAYKLIPLGDPIAREE
ncbi:hypothetical protein D7243_19405 [Stutzerimonas stutzeri]|jgi:hypothetical protein|nr:hypothetical protein [Stutzerimonas stutzeri]